MIELLRAASLSDVPHGFAGRRGGVSTGVHAGLNVGLGSADEREAVLRNRDLARDALLPGASLVTVRQVHSPDVVTVTGPIGEAHRPAADAMVTNLPGRASCDTNELSILPATESHRSFHEVHAD